MIHKKRIITSKETTHELFQSIGTETAGVIVTSYHNGSRTQQARDIRRARTRLRQYVNMKHQGN